MQVAVCIYMVCDPQLNKTKEENNEVNLRSIPNITDTSEKKNNSRAMLSRVFS